MAGTSRELKLAVVASGDPSNGRMFSGTASHITAQLERDHPGRVHQIRSPRPPWFDAFRKAATKLTAGRYDAYWSHSFLKSHTRRIARELDSIQPDAVVCIAATPFAAGLNPYFRCVHVSDATFELMSKYYPQFVCLSERVRRQAEKLETIAIARSAHSTFSSRWAARSALDHYGAAPEKVSVIPWGCNMDFIPDQAKNASDDVCRLLFIAVDWDRKGGDVAFEVSQELETRSPGGYQLEVVGVSPPKGVAVPQNVNLHGFLRKNIPHERHKLIQLFSSSSALLLPSRQDCTPMVIAEGNAYGLPSIGRDTGGVTGVIRDGENGLVLPGNAGSLAFVDAVLSLWNDRERYLSMCRKSRLAYDERLNWDAWSSAMGPIIEKVAC